MKNVSMAESYIRRAERRLIDAKRALNENYMPDAIRYSQECLEILVKAMFRLIGIEYPKAHDLSAELQLYADRFPSWFKEDIAWIATLMRDLAKSRGLSFYGDEERGIPPEELFSQGYTGEVVDKVEKCFKLSKKMLDEWKKAAN